MATLSNSPRQLTRFRLEARKSFTFGVWFKLPNGNPIDLTDTVLTMDVSKPTNQSDPTGVVYSGPADFPDAEGGYARFSLQAEDLDLKADIYPYSITFENEGYNGVVVKGELEILDNADFAFPEYDPLDPAQNLQLVFKAMNRIDVTVQQAMTDGQIRDIAGQVVDELALLKSLGLNKGDIITFSAAGEPFVLPADPEDGLALITDSDADGGVAWGPPAGGGFFLVDNGDGTVDIESDHLIDNGDGTVTFELDGAIAVLKAPPLSGLAEGVYGFRINNSHEIIELVPVATSGSEIDGGTP